METELGGIPTRDNDSYTMATEDIPPDDNRTAMGAVKSFRKTPISSKIYKQGTLALASTIPGKQDEHLINLSDLINRFSTDPMIGLNWAQVRAHEEIYGGNELWTPSKVPEWLRWIKCLLGGSSVFLWIGALLAFTHYSIYTGIMESPPTESLVLGFILVVVILITGTLSYIQEYRWKSMVPEEIVTLSARVLREEEETEVPLETLVLGDIIYVRENEMVPADARILESGGNFSVDNSALTGESEPQIRDVSLTRENQLLSPNMIFRGTRVTEGYCKAVVVRTGYHSLLGQVTELADSKISPPSFLSDEISRFMHLLSTLAFILGVMGSILAFLIGYYWVDAFLFMISIILAIIPENLILIVNLALSISAQRLFSMSMTIKSMGALETLGASSVFVFDKTGTLTNNEVTASHVWMDDILQNIYENSEGPTWKTLIKAAVLVSRDETPVERAIVESLVDSPGEIDSLRKSYPKVAEIPFNSIIKFQLSIHETPNLSSRGYYVSLMGSPLVILSRCSSILIQGIEKPFHRDYVTHFHEILRHLGQEKGERLFAFAEFSLPLNPFKPGFKFNTKGKINFPLNGFRLLGLISLIDPIRPNLSDLFFKLKALGMKIVIVSGDNESTVASVRDSLSLTSSLSIGADELHTLHEEEIESLLVHNQELLFSELNPKDKVEMIQRIQRLGAIVTMVGDGDNDGPALQAADVGVSLGISGTCLAKEASDIILQNDDLGTLLCGIEEGRLMTLNIQKIICYTLVSNVPQIGALLFFLIAQVPCPLSPLSILVIDLGTDIFPALSLAYEEAEDDDHHHHRVYEDENDVEKYRRGSSVLREPPRSPYSSPLLDPRLIFYSMGQLGIIQTVGSLFTYFVIMGENGFWPDVLLGLRIHWDSPAINDLKDSYNQEWTFESRKKLEFSCHAGILGSIVLSQWFTLLVCRFRKRSLLRESGKGFFSLPTLFALLTQTLVAILLIYIPGLNAGLQLESLRFSSWFPILPFMFCIFGYDEIRKAMLRKRRHQWIEKETFF